MRDVGNNAIRTCFSHQRTRRVNVTKGFIEILQKWAHYIRITVTSEGRNKGCSVKFGKIRYYRTKSFEDWIEDHNFLHPHTHTHTIALSVWHTCSMWATYIYIHVYTDVYAYSHTTTHIDTLTHLHTPGYIHTYTHLDTPTHLHTPGCTHLHPPTDLHKSIHHNTKRTREVKLESLQLFLSSDAIPYVLISLLLLFFLLFFFYNPELSIVICSD